MSDVPELDKMIDEHHTFRCNIAFMRQERIFLFSCRIALAAIITACVGLVVGPYCLAATPFALMCAQWFVPRPQWRDPFRRYRHM